MPTYCIEVHRELEDVYIFHRYYAAEPTRKEILASIMSELPSYDDDYGKYEYWEVKESEEA